MDSSQTSFNRVFQNVHGITPTAAKAMGCILQAYPSIQFRIEITGGSAMVYHIAEKVCIIWKITSLLRFGVVRLLPIPKMAD